MSATVLYVVSIFKFSKFRKSELSVSCPLRSWGREGRVSNSVNILTTKLDANFSSEVGKSCVYEVSTVKPSNITIDIYDTLSP